MELVRAGRGRAPQAYGGGRRDGAGVSAEVAVIGDAGEVGGRGGGAARGGPAGRSTGHRAGDPARTAPRSMPPATATSRPTHGAAAPAPRRASAPRRLPRRPRPADASRPLHWPGESLPTAASIWAAVSGSGPGRPGHRAGSRGCAGQRRGQPAAPAQPAPRAPARSRPQFTDVPLTQIRKTIAKRLAQSIGPIPTFYLTSESTWSGPPSSEAQLPEEGQGRRSTTSSSKPPPRRSGSIRVQRLVAGRPHPASGTTCTWAWRSPSTRV